MSFVRACSIPGCTRTAVREVRAVVISSDAIALKRLVCSDATCETIARKSVATRVEVVGV